MVPVHEPDQRWGAAVTFSERSGRSATVRIRRRESGEPVEVRKRSIRSAPMNARGAGNLISVSINVLFAGVSVADFDVALGWYERLFGRPADVVVKTDEVMWRIAESAWLYIFGDLHRAGGSSVALAVDDLERAIAEIEDRGIPSPPIETFSAPAERQWSKILTATRSLSSRWSSPRAEHRQPPR